MVKVINHLGKIISYKLDSFAKLFISKSEILDISLEGQEDRINDMLVNLRDVKASRKNLQGMMKKNEANIKNAELKAKIYLKQKKEDMAKYQIKFKLEQVKQNQALEKNIANMLYREKAMAKTIDKLKDILEISKDKAEFYKATHKAAKSTLGAVDIDTTKNINLKVVMDEISQEIDTMDNKIEAISEMEKEGLLNKEEGSVIMDAEVEAEFAKLKSKK